MSSTPTAKSFSSTSDLSLPVNFLVILVIVFSAVTFLAFRDLSQPLRDLPILRAFLGWPCVSFGLVGLGTAIPLAAVSQSWMVEGREEKRDLHGATNA